MLHQTGLLKRYFNLKADYFTAATEATHVVLLGAAALVLYAAASWPLLGSVLSAGAEGLAACSGC